LFKFTELENIPTLGLRNGILLDRDGVDPQADITVSMNRATFNQLASTPDGLDKMFYRQGLGQVKNHFSFRSQSQIFPLSLAGG
jgi:hypothetical protein